MHLPDRNAVLISAPQISHFLLAQMLRMMCFDSFLKVGLSVAIFPKSGSWNPTSTNLALGVTSVTSGSEDFFHVRTQQINAAALGNRGHLVF